MTKANSKINWQGDKTISVPLIAHRLLQLARFDTVSFDARDLVRELPRMPHLSTILLRFPVDFLGDGRGGDSLSFAVQQIGRIKEMSEEEEVGGVHQRAIVHVIPRLVTEFTSSLDLRERRERKMRGRGEQEKGNREGEEGNRKEGGKGETRDR